MKMRRIFVALLPAIVAVPACVPWVQNVAKMRGPVADSSRFFSTSSDVLVLPIWDEANGDCTIRRPFVTPASSLNTLHEQPKPRKRLGWLGIDGHGPSHYRGIHGFIVVGANGLVVWVGSTESRVAGTLTDDELATLVVDLTRRHDVRAFDRLQRASAGSLETAFPSAMCRDEPIGLHGSQSDRSAAIGFLRSRHNPRDGET